MYLVPCTLYQPDLQAHSVEPYNWWFLHLGLGLRDQPDPGPALSHRQEALTGSQVRDFHVCSNCCFWSPFMTTLFALCRAIWFNVLGIGSLLLLCGYGGMVRPPFPASALDDLMVVAMLQRYRMLCSLVVNGNISILVCR